MGSVVLPVTAFADEPTAWLDHLERLTRHTVGARCAAAELVVVGRRTGEVLDVSAVLKGTGTGAVHLPPVPRDFDGSEALHPSVRDGSVRWCSRSPGRTGAGSRSTGRVRRSARPSADDLDGQIDAATWFVGCRGTSTPASRRSSTRPPTTTRRPCPVPCVPSGTSSTTTRRPT